MMSLCDIRRETCNWWRFFKDMFKKIKQRQSLGRGKGRSGLVCPFLCLDFKASTALAVTYKSICDQHRQDRQACFFFRGTISVHSGADMWCYNMCLAQTFSTTVRVFSICENWVTLSMWAYFGVCWGSVSKLSLRACWNQFIEPVRNGIIVVI